MLSDASKSVGRFVASRSLSFTLSLSRRSSLSFSLSPQLGFRRAYINTFTDKSKQVAIDMLLGMLADQRQIEIFDPVNQQLKRTLFQRSARSRFLLPFCHAPRADHSLLILGTELESTRRPRRSSSSLERGISTGNLLGNRCCLGCSLRLLVSLNRFLACCISEN